MRKHFRLGCGSVGETVPQNLRDAAMQDLAPAFQQIFVSRVLNR
jgi:hypothetical protein